MSTRTDLSNESDVIKNLDKTSASQFRIDSDRVATNVISELLFGLTDILGIRNYYGRIQAKHADGNWFDIGTGSGSGVGSANLEIYPTYKLGNQSENIDYKTFIVDNGEFKLDGSNLFVCVNGIYRCVQAGDFTIPNTTTIVFNDARRATDKIMMLIFATSSSGSSNNTAVNIWERVTGNVKDIPSTGGWYSINNSTGCVLQLPSTAAFGVEVKLANRNLTGNWKLIQNANQQIIFGDKTTTVGTDGYIESTSFGDSISLVCVEDDTIWQVTYSLGNINYV